MAEEFDSFDTIAVPGHLFWDPASRCTTLGKILGHEMVKLALKGNMLEIGVSSALDRIPNIHIVFLDICFHEEYHISGNFSLSYTQRA